MMMMMTLGKPVVGAGLLLQLFLIGGTLLAASVRAQTLYGKCSEADASSLIVSSFGEACAGNSIDKLRVYLE